MIPDRDYNGAAYSEWAVIEEHADGTQTEVERFADPEAAMDRCASLCDEWDAQNRTDWDESSDAPYWVVEVPAGGGL